MVDNAEVILFYLNKHSLVPRTKTLRMVEVTNSRQRAAPSNAINSKNTD